MRKIILLNSTFTSNKVGESVDMYSTEEVLNFPNIDDDESWDIENIAQYETISGWVKAFSYTDEEPHFIQMYEEDFEEVN